VVNSRGGVSDSIAGAAGNGGVVVRGGDVAVSTCTLANGSGAIDRCRWVTVCGDGSHIG
jgi:hypothetical protein